MCSEITWKAIYNDGTELPQYKADGIANKYPDIDRSKLKFFELHQGEKLLFKLHLEKGRRLIARKINFIDIKVRDLEKQFAIDAILSGQKIKKTNRRFIWMVGWQWDAKCSNLDCLGSRNMQDIAWIFPDGHVELTGQFKEMPYASFGKLMDCEKEIEEKGE